MLTPILEGMSRVTRASPLGEYIRRERNKRGWTQDVLADAVGTSGAYISQIETGRVAWPGAHLRRGIASALGVSHLEMLVAAGELTAEEAGLVGDGTTAADGIAALYAELTPYLRRIADQPALADRLVKSVRNTVELLEELSPPPPTATDAEAPEESRPESAEAPAARRDR